MQMLDTALDQWEAVLGADHIVRDPEVLVEAEKTTYAPDEEHRVLGILQPDSLEEVQACVRIANETGVPLYPMSRGRNYGYGTRVPLSLIHI